MRERDISVDEIGAILTKDVESFIYPSKQDSRVDMYFGKVDEKYIIVFCNRNTNKLVTVRKMRKKEKDFFEKELKNERKKD
jgi:uncharacterized DUF497 family protein